MAGSVPHHREESRKALNLIEMEPGAGQPRHSISTTNPSTRSEPGPDLVISSGRGEGLPQEPSLPPDPGVRHNGVIPVSRHGMEAELEQGA